MRRLPLALTAAFVLAGVTAPGAGAAQYCVQFTGACDDTEATLQAALDAAGGTPEDDVIRIGAVTIEESGPVFGDILHYTSTVGGGNDVTLIGQGADQTTIQRDDDREFGTFTTDPGSSHVTLQDLGFLIVGNGDVNDTAAFPGVRAREGGATMTRVRVTAQDVTVADGDFGAGARLVFASGPLTMSDSTIDGAGNANSECLTVSAGNAPVVTGTEFKDCDFGVRANTSNGPSIDRSTFSNVKTGAWIQGDSSISINRSKFIGGPSGFHALNFEANSEFRIDNSLVARGADSGAIRVAPAAGNSASGTVNQSTLVGTGPVASVGLGADASAAGSTASVEVYDSIITGFFQPTLGASGGTLTTAHSFYDFASASQPAGAGDIDSQGDTVDPGFANPPNDYSLASTSILRDKDPLTTTRTGEVFTTDLAGVSRVSNGARDIGAYEFQFVPPGPVITPPAAIAPPGAAPTLGAKKKKCKKAKKRASAAKKCKRKPAK